MANTVMEPTEQAEDQQDPSFWVGRLVAALEQLLEVVIDPDYPDLLKPSQIEVARCVWADCMAHRPHLAAMVSGRVSELLSRDVTADEALVAQLTGDVVVPLMDLSERCDRCNGTDTYNPEGICDECMADLDSPAMDGGGF